MIKFEDYVSLNGEPTKRERLEAFAEKHNIRNNISAKEIVQKLSKSNSRQEKIMILINSLSHSKDVDKNYWMRTDLDNPPFEEGQKVWIRSTMIPFLDHDEAHLLASPQIVNKMIPIPCADVNLWGITLKGCELVLTSEDIEAVD
jgi:hypothetical protein